MFPDNCNFRSTFAVSNAAFLPCSALSSLSTGHFFLWSRYFPERCLHFAAPSASRTPLPTFGSLAHTYCGLQFTSLTSEDLFAIQVWNVASVCSQIFSGRASALSSFLRSFRERQRSLARRNVNIRTWVVSIVPSSLASFCTSAAETSCFSVGFEGIFWPRCTGFLECSEAGSL